MPKLVIQSGHFGRLDGATGGPGERELMIRYARAAKALVDQVEGWSTQIIAADASPDITLPGDVKPASTHWYGAGDVFVALHADASGSSATRGWSVGYQNDAGRTLAHRWRDRWDAEAGDNVVGSRPDNYTTGLGRYYGVRLAIAAGTTRAFIVEHGFMTHPDERRWLESDDAVAAAGRSVCIAVTGTLPNTPAGGLTMADVDKLMDAIDELRKQLPAETAQAVADHPIDHRDPVHGGPGKTIKWAESEARTLVNATQARRWTHDLTTQVHDIVVDAGVPSETADAIMRALAERFK